MLARELEAPMSRLHGQSPTGPVIMQLRGLIAQLRPGQELFEDIQTLDTLPGDERTDDWISQDRERDALAQDFSRELRSTTPSPEVEQIPQAAASADADDPVAALEAMFASFGSGEPAPSISPSRAAPPLSFGFDAQDEDPASLDQIPDELGAERSWAPREGGPEDYQHDAAALEAMFSALDAPGGAPQQTSDELVDQAEQAEHASSPGSSRQDDWFEDGFSFVTPETAAPAVEPNRTADSAADSATADASGDEDDFEFRLDPPSGDELKLDFGLDLDDEPPSRPDSRELSAPREGSGERWLDRDALLSDEQDAAARAAEATRLPGVNDLQFDLSAPAEPTPAASADFDDLAALLNAPPPEAEDEADAEAAPGLEFDMGSVTGEALPEHLSEPKPAHAGSGELALELDLGFDDPAPDPLADHDPATFNAEHDEALQAALAASSKPGEPRDEDEDLDFDLGFSAAPPPRDDVEFDLDFKPPAVEKPVGEEGSPWPFELPGVGAAPEAEAAPTPEAPADDADDADDAARLARHEQPTTEAPALDLFMRFNDDEDANQEGQVPSSGPFRWPTEDAPDAGFTRQATPAKDESVHDALLQLSSMGRQPAPEEDSSSSGEVPEDEFFALAEELASEASRSSHYRGEPIGYRGESNPFLLDTPTGISEVDPRVVDPKQYMDATPPPAPAAPEPSFVLEELPPPPPIPEEKTTAERAREAYNAGELDRAEELAREALAEDAGNEDAQRLINQVESERERQALAKLGSLYETPALKVSMGEVMGMNLDSRAGYMLSQIDGMISFEDLLDLSAMERLETLTLLADLLDRGVIGLD